MKLGNPSCTLAFLLLATPLLLTCCAPDPVDLSPLTPVGRSAVVAGNSFQVLIDAEPYDPRVTPDNYGGYSAEIPYDPQEGLEVLLQVTIDQHL